MECGTERLISFRIADADLEEIQISRVLLEQFVASFGPFLRTFHLVRARSSLCARVLTFARRSDGSVVRAGGILFRLANRRLLPLVELG